MKVHHAGSNPVQGSEISGAQRAEKTKEARQSRRESPVSGAESADVRADISSRSKEFAQARSVADAAPDVRAEKIAELKKRIAEGRYNVSPHAVADRMVDDHLKSGIG